MRTSEAELLVEVEGLRARVAQLKAAAPSQWVLELIRDVATSVDFDAALAKTLRAMCERAGWALAEAWVPDVAGVVLEPSPHRFAAPPVTVELAAFLASSSSLAMPLGRGLPGRVWAHAKAEWIDDVASASEVQFRRAEAARRAGLHAAVGIPIVAGKAVVAVLVFFLGRRSDIEEEKLSLLHTVAAELADVLRRKQREEVIVRQAREILDLSVPLLVAGDRVLVAPLVGRVDAERMMVLTERAVAAAVAHSARAVLIDMSGIPAIDADTARGLLDVARALDFVGSRAVVTGLRASAAMSLAQLGVDLSALATAPNVAAGLELVARYAQRAS